MAAGLDEIEEAAKRIQAITRGRVGRMKSKRKQAEKELQNKTKGMEEGERCNEVADMYRVATENGDQKVLSVLMSDQCSWECYAHASIGNIESLKSAADWFRILDKPLTVSYSEVSTSLESHRQYSFTIRSTTSGCGIELCDVILINCSSPHITSIIREVNEGPTDPFYDGHKEQTATLTNKLQGVLHDVGLQLFKSSSQGKEVAAEQKIESLETQINELKDLCIRQESAAKDLLREKDRHLSLCLTRERTTVAKLRDRIAELRSEIDNHECFAGKQSIIKPGLVLKTQIKTEREAAAVQYEQQRKERLLAQQHLKKERKLSNMECSGISARVPIETSKAEAATQVSFDISKTLSSVSSETQTDTERSNSHISQQMPAEEKTQPTESNDSLINSSESVAGPAVVDSCSSSDDALFISYIKTMLSSNKEFRKLILTEELCSELEHNVIVKQVHHINQVEVSDTTVCHHSTLGVQTCEDLKRSLAAEILLTNNEVVEARNYHSVHSQTEFTEHQQGNSKFVVGKDRNDSNNIIATRKTKKNRIIPKDVCKKNSCRRLPPLSLTESRGLCKKDFWEIHREWKKLDFRDSGTITIDVLRGMDFPIKSRLDNPFDVELEISDFRDPLAITFSDFTAFYLRLV